MIIWLVFRFRAGSIPNRKTNLSRAHSLVNPLDFFWWRVKLRPMNCSIPKCKEPLAARAMCQPHYNRWRRGLRDAALLHPIRKNNLGLPDNVLESIKRSLR